MRRAPAVGAPELLSARSASALAASTVELEHPTRGDVRVEAKAVGDRRRNEDRGGRGERQLRRFERHVAAAALDQQNLK